MEIFPILLGVSLSCTEMMQITKSDSFICPDEKPPRELCHTAYSQITLFKKCFNVLSQYSSKDGIKSLRQVGSKNAKSACKEMVSKIFLPCAQAPSNSRTRKTELGKIDKLILASIFSSNNVQNVKAFIDHIVSDDVPLMASRKLLQIFAQELGKLEPEAHKEVAHYALAQIQPRVVSFEEQVSIMREKLAELFETEQQWLKIAQMLSGIPILSNGRIEWKRWSKTEFHIVFDAQTMKCRIEAINAQRDKCSG